MKVGLFLGYGPDTVLGKEGLGRYLGNLIRNLQSNGNEVAIACPEWNLDALDRLFKDFGIDYNSVDFIIANKIPVIWRLYHYRSHKKKKYRNPLWEKGFKLGADAAIDIVMSVTNAVTLVCLCLLALLLFVLLLPIMLVATLLYWIFSFLLNVKNRSKNKLKGACLKVVQAYEKLSANGMRIYSILYNDLLEKLQKQLVYKINRNSDVDVWYSPAVFWPAFNDIKAPKLINVPDLVTGEFATKWGDNKEILYSTKRCEQTIENGEYFVTYSEYVKNTLLIRKFNKKAENIYVIPHGINDLSSYITINSGVVCKMGLVDTFTTQYCKSVIDALKVHTHGIDNYIVGFNFDDVDYIFYPSQARPHKNLLNLIKAYEMLLRKRYVRVKLFLTCNLDTLPEVKNYIVQHRLQYDIVSFYDVSVKGLAALYRQACLVVNPTLYEGGFPFTFGEGMSVGTPSVMGHIAQVRELTDQFDMEDVLFDPYDIKDMANKIEYGIKNKERILEKEQKLYQWMTNEYSQEKMGALYVRAFRELLEKN